MATSTNARRRSATIAPEDAPVARRPRQPSKIKRMVRILLLVLIVIAASVGATLYYTWPTGTPLFGFLQKMATDDASEPTSSPPPPPPAPSEKPIFTKLEPFTVTLNDGGSRSRILHVAITLRVEDEHSAILLHEYMPVVRDRVLKILSEQHPIHVQSPEGREQLVDFLSHSLRTPYDRNTNPPRIANVLFTAFVIQ